MKFTIEPKKIEWWFWTITLTFIVVALFGWSQGYYLVVLISAIQVLCFWIRSGSVLEFDTQVRIAYFVFTLLGLIKAIRFPFFILMFIGTFMVVAFNRCGIALVLKKMPWNKQSVVRIKDNLS